MSNQSEPGVVRRISWSEFCPWLLLLRTFRLSISGPLLVLATAGAMLTPLGWKAAQILFVPAESRDPYFASIAERNARWPDIVAQPEQLIATPMDAEYSRLWLTTLANVPAVYLRFVEPLLRIGSAEVTSRQVLYYLSGGMWNVLLWSLVAGIITRVAAVQLGREERLGVAEAWRHVRRNLIWYVIAPVFPLLFVLLTLLPIALLGLLMRTSAGVLVTGVLWPLVLLGGFVMAVLLVGLLGGWPLMWPTISSEEGSDAFEAFSRSYSYTFQRPLHYLGYALLAIAYGGLCWLLVSRFSDAVVDLATWAAGWGAGRQRMVELLAGPSQGLESVGVSAMALFNGTIRGVAAGFNYSFFFCSATAIYLLLRRHVDQTELDEVFVESETDRYGLAAWHGEEEGPQADDAAAGPAPSDPKPLAPDR